MNRKWIHAAKLSLISLTLTSAPSFAATSMDFACFSAIDPYTSSGNQTDLTYDVGYAAVVFADSHQGTRQGANQGLYLLTPNANYFYQFPTATSQPVEYDLQISVPQQAPFYLGYQFIPGDSPSVVWSPSPLEGVNYTAPQCEAVNDTSAETAIENFLAAKVATVSAIYNVELMKCTSTGHCRPKQDFITALNSCTLSGLQQPIAAAVASLSGMPDCGCPQ